MATVACVHHLEQPFLGHAEAPLRRGAVTVEERFLSLGDPLPALAEVDGIISFGGGQSVLDIEHDASLQAEARLLGDAVEAGVPVLGVCLGAQLLAHALGAEVRRAPRRSVAWVPLDALPAAAADPIFSGLGSPVAALHWDEDVFALPAGATDARHLPGQAETADRLFGAFASVVRAFAAARR